MLSGCGGGSNSAVETAQAQTPSPGIDAGRGAAITLSAPQTVAGSNRIALRWSAHSRALTFSVLLQRSERDPFVTVAEGLTTSTTVIDRGAAWRLDFPTARVKVRGCNPGRRCTDSNEQPLLAALMAGIVALRSDNPDRSRDVNNPGTDTFDFFSLHHALDRDGNTLAATAVDLLYVFGRDAAGKWQTPAKVPSQLGALPLRLSSDGNTLVVMNNGERGTFGGIDPPPGSGTGDFFTTPFIGAVYVFARDGQGEWHLQAHIRQDVRRDFESFGESASLSHDGHLLAVSSSASGSGRVYLFVRDGAGVWHQDSTMLTPPPAPNFEQYQGPAALSGNGRVLGVGGVGQIDRGNFLEVYRFVDLFAHTPQTGWLRQTRLNSRRPAFLDIDDFFGTHLAIDHDGTTVAVGAPEDDSDDTDTVGDPNNSKARLSGAVYIFERTAENAWPQQAFLKARQAAPMDRFGLGIALSEDGRVLLGKAFGLAANVPGVNRNNEADRAAPTDPLTGSGGAGYVFALRDDGTWREVATALPPVIGRVADAFFSISLSGDGKTFALGADAFERVGDVLTDRARVYVY